MLRHVLARPYLRRLEPGALVAELNTSSNSAASNSLAPAQKPKLPGHAESYNPPKEYLPTEVGILCGEGEAGGSSRQPQAALVPESLSPVMHLSFKSSGSP